MAKLELHISIYPTVWVVVLKETGLPKYEVSESIWATEQLAQARAFVLAGETGQQWEVVPAKVGHGSGDT
ncbi:hypothetical protein [Paractinoplanes atraurantiacus]|uniref:Uncharacterized protein n=1 Tax=Paractinoplanes atraurantiacus TaxID=1036182 RepID=A0A285GZK5_9ACTN|nr:hypothetical protein [Actinoplanes atraurantiacus]SNY28952.1 hypothetical protein SAMN05421748_103164 [Actinoplanes atraurantiacus]